MRRVVLAGLVIALGTATSPGHAADRSGNFGVKGFGLETCQSYVAAKSANAPLYFLSRSWLNGYLSAYNQLTPSTYEIAGGADLEALAAWLETYCKARPRHSFVIAVTSLTAALHPRRLQDKPQAGAAVAPSQADVETVRRIQKALKDKGYYTGSVDGLFGPGTQMGLEAFQRKEGLNVTGQPDVPTLDRLNLLR